MQTSCDNHSHTLSVAQALQYLYSELQPINGVEQLPIRNALGRILAKDVYSPNNVPPHDHSAMDGYAVRSADLPNSGKVQLQIVGTSWAGKPYTQMVEAQQCVRIFTGGVIPLGSDTVIMQEDVEIKDNIMILATGHEPGQHVGKMGEDLTIGQKVLVAGKRLTPADIGLLASLGIPEVQVKRRLRIAFFSTGDELCPLGKQPQLGQIYDSNRYTLHSLLSYLGVEPIDMGIVPDNRQDIENAFLLATKQADVLITSGGVSVGDADYVIETLQRIGKVNFWKIAMKPGRPLTFGKIEQTTFFGLPGNPVSAMATFYQIVQPALRQLMGQIPTTPLRFQVKCLSSLKKRPGRMEFQRGILTYDESGQLVVRSTGKQGSAMLSSMSQANCFIILPEESGNVMTGSTVLVEPFEEWI
jgi:molybdopterin molybdotransferase